MVRDTRISRGAASESSPQRELWEGRILIQAPEERQKTHNRCHEFFRPCRDLNLFASFPTVCIVGCCRTLLRS